MHWQSLKNSKRTLILRCADVGKLMDLEVDGDSTGGHSLQDFVLKKSVNTGGDSAKTGAHKPAENLVQDMGKPCADLVQDFLSGRYSQNKKMVEKITQFRHEIFLHA